MTIAVAAVMFLLIKKRKFLGFILFSSPSSILLYLFIYTNTFLSAGSVSREEGTIVYFHSRIEFRMDV